MIKNGLLVIMMVFVMTSFAQEQKKASNKELKTVTYKCNMHCTSCQEKIEHNIAFEKGVKAITTDIEDNTVTVTYKTDKSSAEKIKKAIIDLGYTAKIQEKEEKKKAKAIDEE